MSLKDNIIATLKDSSLSLSQAADQIQAKIDAEKAKMDTETRRKVRAFWICVSVLTAILGFWIRGFVTF